MSSTAAEAVSFAAYRDFVHWQLKRFGASSGALDDLTQEVWVVSLTRSPRLLDDTATRAWLTQVCRRVVASDWRSRARSPLLYGPAPEIRVAPEQVERIDDDQHERQRQLALARLSDAEIDLLTLYGGGQLSMREVAELVGAPEQTVYSQYRAAVERASRELRRQSHAQADASAELSLDVPDAKDLWDSDEAAADQGEFVFYRRDEELGLGRLGNVVLCRWRRRAYVESTRALEAAIRLAHARMQLPVLLVNDLDADMRLPNVDERKALREHIRTTSELVPLVVDVIANATLRHMISAVIGGIMVFTRSPTSLVLVGTAEAASQALVGRARTSQRALGVDELAGALAALHDAAPPARP
ncbi:MAG: sigma-70 family RNA polymerase sigma factor [Myxococcales bacterium]